MTIHDHDSLSPREAAYIAHNCYFTLKDWMTGTAVAGMETRANVRKMVLGDGHQGIQETAYGTYRFNKAKKEPEIIDVMRFPAECVNPPPGIDADKWIEGGMKGAKC